MPILEFTQQTMPNQTKFRQLLHEINEQHDPVEELLMLERQLLTLEQKYNLASSEFYRQYRAGELGDDIAFVTWAGRYRLYISLKQAISESLKMVLAEPVGAFA